MQNVDKKRKKADFFTEYQARSQPQNSKGAPATSKGAHNLHPQKKLLPNLPPSP